MRINISEPRRRANRTKCALSAVALERLEDRTLWSGSPSLSWKTQASDPVPRAEGASFVADGKLFCFGGFSDVNLTIKNEMDAYNPASNSWTRMADCPVKVNDAPVTLDPVTDTAYTGGFFLNDGFHASGLVYAYHVKTNTWTQSPSLPANVGAGQMGVVGRDLHYFGGRDSNNVGSVLHWKLNLDDPNAKWVADQSMPFAVNHDAAVVLNNKIYAIGGIINKQEFDGNKNYVQVFNPATDSWSLAGSLPYGIGHIASAATVAEGKIVLAGGQLNASGQTFSKAVLQYDPAADKWTNLNDLPDYRASPFVGYANGELIVTGGNMYTKPYVVSATWTAAYAASSLKQLTGKTIGTSGSYQNAGNTISKVTDGNLNTFFDSATASGSWVGFDLGSTVSISQISVAPRSGYASRMLGGQIQVSTTADFSSGVTTLYKITATPPAGTLTTVTLTAPVMARYIRYLSPANSYGNISEFQVFG